MNNIINRLAGLGDTKTDMNKFAGQPLAEELTAMEDLNLSLELPNNEGINALNDLEIESICATEEMTIEGVVAGLEAAPVEMAKRAGYTLVGTIKKLIHAVLGFVKKQINLLTKKNLYLKKFKAVIKKYREKLSKTGINEKASDKDIKVRYIEGPSLTDFVDLAESYTKTTLGLDSLDAVKAAKSGAALVSAAAYPISAMTFGVSEFADIKVEKLEDIKEALKDKKILEAVKEKLDKYKFEKVEVKLTDARVKMLSIASKLESSINKDVKVQDKLRKFVDMVEKQMNKIIKDVTTANGTEDLMKAKALVEKIPVIVTQSQTAITKLFNAIATELNGFITDMYAVIVASK